MCPCFLHNFTMVGLGGIKESLDVGKQLICLAFKVELPFIACMEAIYHNEDGIPKHVIRYQFTCIESIIGKTLVVPPQLGHVVIGI